MSAKQAAIVDGKVVSAMATLRPPAPTSEAPLETDLAMKDKQACRVAILRMFESAGDDAVQLANQVFATQLPEVDKSRRFEAPLLLASALHAVCGSDASMASKLLEAARGDEQSTRSCAGRLAALHRVLAATNAGMGVLRHLEGDDDPARAEMFGDVMRLAIDMSRHGLEPGGAESRAESKRRVEVLMNGDKRLQAPIGAKDDPPQQLLLQAYLYASHQLDGAELAPEFAACKSAYVAWKKGGFTQSGKGTDFNRAIERLNKFAVYVRRGDHGPRTAGNLARDMLDLAPRLVGKHKSPMSRFRYGDMGGALSTLDGEAVKFRAALDDAIDPLVAHGWKQASDAAARQASGIATKEDGRRFARALARIATLEQWQAHGRKGVPVDVPDVLQRVETLRQALSAETNRPIELDVRQVLREIGGTSMLRKNGAGKRDGVKLQLTLLERWGEEAMTEVSKADVVKGSAAAFWALDKAMQRAGDARTIARAKSESVALFQWRDLYDIAAGNEPRMGPNVEHAQRIVGGAAKAPYESSTHVYDGSGIGVNVSAVLGLTAGHGAAAVPALRAETSRMAEVAVGVSVTGGRFFVGKRRLRSLATGVTGAFGVSILNIGIAAGFMEASIGRDWNDGEGASIATRNDRAADGERDRVVDFMYAHAAKGKRTGQDFWRDFVQRFGDDAGVTLSWNGEHARTTTGVLGAGVTARANVGSGVSVGPQLSAQLRRVDERVGRTTNGQGGDVPFEFRAHRVALSGAATLVAATPAKSISGPVFDSVLNVVPLLGVAGEKVLSGSGGVARIGRNDNGTLSPKLCQHERQVRSREDMIQLVEARRDVWEKAMQGAKADSMDPRALHPRVRLDAFLREIQALPAQGNQTFGELTSLRPEVAAQIDAYEARLVTLLAGDVATPRRPLLEADRVECERLRVEADRLVADDASWMPVALYAFEANLKASSGLDLGVRLGTRGEMGANRLTALLLPGKPDLDARD